MACVGQTCSQFVHWWHSAVVINAFLSSLLTIIALEGHTFSHFLHPIQASLSTFSDILAKRPNTFCNAPNGQIRLWNTSGLYLRVTRTDTTTQKGRTGKSRCKTFFDTIITTILTPSEIHVKYPFFSHLGAFAVWNFSFFDSHSTGIITVFIGQAYPQ